MRPNAQQTLSVARNWQSSRKNGVEAPKSVRSGQATRRSRKRSKQSQQSRRKKSKGPQLWVTTMWHAGTGLPWDWRTGSADSSERAHLREMIDALPPYALVTADAGFVGSAYWNALIESGREFVIRVGSNVRLIKKLGYVRESAGTVYLWPDREARHRRLPLVLRLVIVHDGRQPWYLVTSVCETARLNDQDIAELYRHRWGIELFYRHFKQTFGRRKLRSHKAEHAQCEANWSLVGLWTMLLYATFQLHRLHIPPRRLSVAGVLRADRVAMRESKNHPEPGESLREHLKRAVIDNYQRANKKSRAYPRKKYEPPPKPPLLQTATRLQKKLARFIRLKQKGLTA